VASGRNRAALRWRLSHHWRNGEGVLGRCARRACRHPPACDEETHPNFQKARQAYNSSHTFPTYDPKDAKFTPEKTAAKAHPRSQLAA